MTMPDAGDDWTVDYGFFGSPGERDQDCDGEVW